MRRKLILSVLWLCFVLCVMTSCKEQELKEIPPAVKEVCTLSESELSIHLQDTAGETELDDADFIEHEARLMHTWCDDAGNVLWSGLTKEEIKELTKEERERFEEWWQQYTSNIYDEVEEQRIAVDRKGKTAREYFSWLCEDYNGYIPFSEGGRTYALGYDKYKNGIDNRSLEQECKVSFGLDSQGYLIWLFRNTFGYTPNGLEGDIVELCLNSKQITNISNLRVGDICLLSNDSNAPYNMCGVVAGIVEGHVVVSVCDNTCTKKFPNGCNRIAYIRSDRNELIGESMPINFTYFYRLDLEWGDE